MRSDVDAVTDQTPFAYRFLLRPASRSFQRASFAFTRFARLVDPARTCDIADLDSVLLQYSYLFNLDWVFRHIDVERFVDFHPDLLKLRADEMGESVKAVLECAITAGVAESQELVSGLEKLILAITTKLSLAKKRIRLVETRRYP